MEWLIRTLDLAPGIYNELLDALAVGVCQWRRSAVGLSIVDNKFSSLIKVIGIVSWKKI